MQLVSCPGCRTQFDVTGVDAPTITCTCGTRVPNAPLRAVDATVERCGSCGAALEPDTARCAYCTSPVVKDARHLTLICPECYARNTDSARFCTHCGVAFSPQPVVVDGECLPCPACTHALTPRTLDHVLVHECPRCMGVWTPGESFDVLVDKAMEARRTRASEGLGHGPARPGDAPGSGTRDWRVEYRSCPVCGGQMQRKNYARRSGVIVDWCGEHGTWLDADELGAIAAFIMDGGLDRARREGTTDAPMSAAEARAMAEAERIMAGAKMAQARRRSPLNEPVLHGRSPLIELFDALLRR